MIFDTLDVLNPKTRFTASARYYPERLNSPDVGYDSLNFEYVNPYSNTYRRLFANVQTAAGQVAIRTDDQNNYKVGGFIILQDNKAYQILEVLTDYQAANKQVLRLFGAPVSVEYVIRMLEVDNPWSVQ